MRRVFLFSALDEVVRADESNVEHADRSEGCPVEVLPPVPPPASPPEPVVRADESTVEHADRSEGCPLEVLPPLPPPASPPEPNLCAKCEQVIGESNQSALPLYCRPCFDEDGLEEENH